MSVSSTTDTSLGAAQANVLASSLAQCEHLNENLKSIFWTAFNNWKIAVDAGRVDNRNPPKPPQAFVVKKDPASGFSFPEPGDRPVCDMPPIPENMLSPRPQPLPVPSSVRNCMPGDIAPIGFVVTDPDGGRWQKQGAPTPFGIAYYYARIG